MMLAKRKKESGRISKAATTALAALETLEALEAEADAPLVGSEKLPVKPIKKNRKKAQQLEGFLSDLKSFSHEQPEKESIVATTAAVAVATHVQHIPAKSTMAEKIAAIKKELGLDASLWAELGSNSTRVNPRQHGMCCPAEQLRDSRIKPNAVTGKLELHSIVPRVHHYVCMCVCVEEGLGQGKEGLSQPHLLPTSWQDCRAGGSRSE